MLAARAKLSNRYGAWKEELLVHQTFQDHQHTSRLIRAPPRWFQCSIPSSISGILRSIAPHITPAVYRLRILMGAFSVVTWLAWPKSLLCRNHSCVVVAREALVDFGAQSFGLSGLHIAAISIEIAVHHTAATSRGWLECRQRKCLG